MTMGFKLQTVSCKFPSEILDVTDNHMSAINQLDLEPAIREDVTQFYQTFQSVTPFIIYLS